MVQTLYNGVRFPVEGPDIDNVERLDLSALPMINRMTQTGLQVDLSHFEKMDKILTQDMEDITDKIKDITGHYINVGSGDQVSDLLFKKLKIKQARPKMTRSGDRESTENEVLVAIQHEHEVVPLILNYKEYEKLRGTYVRPMPKLAKRTDFGKWRVYPNLGCTRTPSGRLNCKEPNLLAMPNRTDRGRQVCEGFITDPGWCYLSVDFSQIEPRIVAHRSGDENLRDVYVNGEDVYSDFAITAFRLDNVRYRCSGVAIPFQHDGVIIVCDDKDHTGGGSWHYPSVHKKKHRFPAKTCILASIYDVSPPGLVEQMPVVCAGCGLDAVSHTCNHYRPLWNETNCGELITAFYIKYHGIMKMRMMDHKRARKHTYVWDDFGRIMHSTAVRSVLNWVVSAALREAANMPIQSGAQGVIKVAMPQVDDDFIKMGIYGDIANIHLQIHDELLFSVREDMAVEIGSYVASIFENCIRLEVPVKASTAMAPVWGKMPK